MADGQAVDSDNWGLRPQTPRIRGQITMQNDEPLSVASRRKHFDLNPHEERLIALIVAGYTSKESARRLGISKQALRQHLGNIYDKLNVSNHFELALFAFYHQLIDLDHMSPPGQ